MIKGCFLHMCPKRHKIVSKIHRNTINQKCMLWRGTNSFAKVFSSHTFQLHGSNNKANSTLLRRSMLGMILPFHFRKDTYSLEISRSPRSNLRISLLLGSFLLPNNRYGPT